MRRARRSTSSPRFSATANSSADASMKKRARRSCRSRARAPAPAAACTRPTRWPRRSKPWACRLPYSASIPAEDPGKMDECIRSGVAIRNLLERDIKPRDIMTRAAFENAMVVVMALGGSTNAVLHLIAMAHRVEVALTIDDFQNGQQPRAVSGRFEAQRQVRAGRPAQRRRHAGRDEISARKGFDGRRLLDGHRQDARRKLVGAAGPQSRPESGDDDRKPDQDNRPHPDSARQSVARGAVAKITGKEGSASKVRQRCSILKKTCFTRWNKSRSPRETW